MVILSQNSQSTGRTTLPPTEARALTQTTEAPLLETSLAIPAHWVGGYRLGPGELHVEATRFPQASGLTTTEPEGAWHPDSPECWNHGTDVPLGIATAPPFEAMYDALGKRQGSQASQMYRSQLQEWWIQMGPIGALWLCERLRTDHFVERQSDAINVLAALGTEAISPIIATLDESPSEFQAEALLEAVKWLESPDAFIPQLRRILARYLEHRSADIRVAAAKATQLLPPTLATSILRRALAHEDIGEVREEIEDQLNT